MLELLKELCLIDGTSGDENRVRDFIISEIDGFCKWETDNLGNIIAFKEGKNESVRKLMIDAHMDEVGLIITSVTSEGFLKFKTVGGIDVATIMNRRVRINGNIYGAVSGKPIHLIDKESSKKLPCEDSLFIDIGATSKEDALKIVSLGDCAVLCGEYRETGDGIISKALDDRIGCAVLIELLRKESEYSFYASFSVQEEVGLRGAKASAYAINPDFAIVLESTTASDIAEVPESKTVCNLGEGVAVSFMDGATVYDRELYREALNSGIKCQPKRAVAGGNNAGALHLNREGVRTLALSVPTRYIHSPSCVANKGDIEAQLLLAEYMINKICGGNLA